MAFNRALAADRRDELGLSNKEVADRAGISEGYLRNIISGADKPGRRTRYALERALRLAKDALLAKDPGAQPDPVDEPAERRTPPSRPPSRRDPRGPGRDDDLVVEARAS